MLNFKLFSMNIAKTVFRTLFAMLLITSLMGCNTEEKQQHDFYLFVGTYTGEGSEGIHLFRFNADEGTADFISETKGVENPSYLAISPDQATLYAVNEVGDSTKASVSSFAFDKKTAELSFLNKQNSHGGAPCYVSVDANGNAVFAGNYTGGSLAMFPVNDDGSLEEAKVAIQHTGSSVNQARQESPHVHCTYVSPDNRRLFVTDLGTDRVSAYEFDEGDKSLQQTPSSVYEAEPGAGPRHLTFHPDGEFAYLVNELNGTVVAFRYEDGSLEPIQTVSTLPEGYDGPRTSADIHVSPDGAFLYATNREDLNNIVAYSIDQNSGQLEKIDQYSTGGVHPRNFVIDPTGTFLLIANRHTDNIVVFRRNKQTGALTPTGTEIKVSQPVCLKMMPVK